MEIFHNLCRCCNSETQNALNIYDNNTIVCNNSESVINMLEYCLQITLLNEPKYPPLICYDCFKQLEISHRFIKRFRLSQTEFEEAYKQVQEINEETIQCNIDENICNTSDKLDRNKTSPDSKRNSLERFNIPDEVEISTEINMTIKDVVPENLINNKKISENLHGIYDDSPADKFPNIGCYICHKTFFTTKALNLHLKLKHKEKYSFN